MFLLIGVSVLWHNPNQGSVTVSMNYLENPFLSLSVILIVILYYHYGDCNWSSEVRYCDKIVWQLIHICQLVWNNWAMEVYFVPVSN